MQRQTRALKMRDGIIGEIPWPVAPSSGIWQIVLEVATVDKYGHANLSKIADTLGSFCLFFRLGQGRQQQRRQNRDDVDDDQQLNQCKAIRGGFVFIRHSLEAGLGLPLEQKCGFHEFMWYWSLLTNGLLDK